MSGSGSTETSNQGFSTVVIMTVSNMLGSSSDDLFTVDTQYLDEPREPLSIAVRG